MCVGLRSNIVNRYQALLLLALTSAWTAVACTQANAAPLPQTTAATIATQAASVTLTRAATSKKAKPRARHTKRATLKRKRKAAHSKRRLQPTLTAARHTAARNCKGRKRARRCRRTHSPLYDAYQPPEITQHNGEAGTALARAVPHMALDGKPDIVEREEDIPIIIQIALTLAGLRVEHALSIVETRDRDTGQISYRIVPGDEAKRTPDQAELPDVTLRDNERIVADIHSHPEIKARGHAIQDKRIAARATKTNLYPGVDDFAAVEKREAVSAILNPNGAVFLLRRIAGAPSVRVVEGPPLAPLESVAAHGLELTYLYDQGYLAAGTWTRPVLETQAHAAASGNPMETEAFVTPAP
jgi:hypothetical protein